MERFLSYIKKINPLIRLKVADFDIREICKTSKSRLHYLRNRTAL
jgi:hypothetical protein